MRNNIFSLPVIAVVAFSCALEESDRIQVPWPTEHTPASYVIGSEGTETLVSDCTNDLGEFSGELEEFILGNITIGPSRSDCEGCGEFSGGYTWTSRCDANYHYDGTWKSTGYGATVSFEPAFSSDSTLQFNAVSSVKFWKLRFDKDDEFIVINYEALRN